MIKITDNTIQTPAALNPAYFDAGTVFKAKHRKNPDRYKGPFLRVYDGVISLSNPEDFWGHHSQLDFFDDVEIVNAELILTTKK